MFPHIWYLPSLSLTSVVQGLSSIPFLLTDCTAWIYFCLVNMTMGAFSSIVGWGTMLQVWRSWDQVPMRWIFSIYLILPATLWSWGRLSLEHKWVPGIFLGDKGRPARRADNLTAICEPIV
jgi:hypothetical protein